MKSIYKRLAGIGKLTLIFLLLASAGKAHAQHGWSFNYADFANSGQVTGLVFLDGSEVSSGSVGAFVGEDCRGITEAPIFFPPTGKYIFTVIIYSNVASGETVTFKYYNPGDGLIYDITETVEFTSDMTEGDAEDPFSFNAITNSAPVVDEPVPNQSLDEHFVTYDIPIGSVFTDPDGDAMTYSATTSSGAIVSVNVVGTTLTLTEVGLGTATITLTADDGLTTTDDEFDVVVNNVNDAPIVINPLADLSPNEGFGTATVNLTSTFSDPDSDLMTYSASSSDNGVVTVSVSGTTLTITEVSNGSATITVRASDPSLAEGYDYFDVTVNNVNDRPVVSSPIPDQPLLEHFSSKTIDLGPVFTDPDGDVLTLTPVTSNPNAVTVGIEDGILTITEVGLGTSTITISANDGSLSVNDVFIVTVTNVNDAPDLDNPVPDQNLSEHFNAISIDVSSVFSDPDAGDVITLSASSSDESVVTVEIVGNDLVITEVGVGSATVTLTATDMGALKMEDIIAVTVTNVNDAPNVVNPISDQSLNEHFTSENINISLVFNDPDGDELILSPSTSNPTVVTVGISGDILTLTEVGNGSSTITINASDGSKSVNETFLVTVNDVNDFPVVESDIADQNLSEHFGSTTLNVSSNFSDPDGDALTFTALSDDATVVTVSMSGSVITFTEQGLGSCNVTVEANDGELEITNTFVVNVANVNDDPVIDNAIADQVYSEHFITETIDLTNVFSDPDNDPLTLTPASSNPGVVTVSIDGNILTITEQGLGISNITITASDGPKSVSDYFSVRVNDVNDPPVVSSATPDQNLDEHFGTQTINLGSTFSDPEGDALTISALSSNPAAISVSISGTTLTLTEEGLGSSTITLTAEDGEFTVDDDFIATVNNVNDAPVATNPVSDQTFSEHFGTTSLDISGVFTDPDDDTMLYSVSSNNSSVVSVAMSGSSIVFTEEGLGTASITLTADDGGKTTNDIFLVTIENVNDAPVVVNAVSNKYYSEGFGTATISLATVFNDPDGDNMVYTAISSVPSVVDISVSGNVMTVSEFGLGTSMITLTATDDGEGTLTTNHTFNITVNNVNDPPTVVNAVSDQVYDEYYGSTNIDLSNVFDDVDAGDVLTLTASSSNTSIVSVVLVGNILTISEEGLGTAVVRVRATDNGEGNLWVEDVFNVTVNNVNDAPTVVSAPSDVTLDEYFISEPVSLVGVFNDIDAGDNLTITATSSDEGVVTVSVSGTLLTIAEAGLGTSLITVTATDDGTPAKSVSTTFDVTVNNVNDAPAIEAPVTDKNYNEHFDSKNIDLSGVFSDKDNDPLVISAGSSNETVVTVTISGTILTIHEEGLGSSIITLTADDGTTQTNSQFTVFVANVNDAPIVDNPVSDQALLEHFDTEIIDLSNVFVDPDNDDLSLSVISSNPGVVGASVDGFILTLTEAGQGSSVITVTANDGVINVSDQFSVSVSNVNDPPEVASAIGTRTYQESFSLATISLTSVFSDPDGDLLTYSAVCSNTSIVTVAISGSSLLITEQGNGTATVTVTAYDGDLLSVQNSFTVNVNNVNDAPVVDNPISNQSLSEHFGTHAISLVGVFSDPDGDVLSYTTSSSNTAVASAGISGTDLILTEFGIGNSTITITANDGNLDKSTSFVVFVANVNDAPEVQNSIENLNLDEHFITHTINVGSVFSDPDNDALDLSATSSNNGIVSANVSGSTLTLTEFGLGSTTITLTASDGALSNNTSFTVTVNNVNDSPVIDNEIADMSLPEHFTSSTIDLSGVFSDPDGNVLSFVPVSGNAAVVTVGVSGTTLTITEQGLGSSTITVTASDGSKSISDQFNVAVYNVNDAPVEDSPIADKSLPEHFGTEDIDVSSVFTDADGDDVSVSAESSNGAVVSVSMIGSILRLTEQGMGTATITLTGSDGTLEGESEFTVTVYDINDAPLLGDGLSDLSLDEHFSTHSISLIGLFSDPDGDVLSYSGTSNNSAVVTVEVIGTSLNITEVGNGSAVITITATDGSLSADDQFTLTVNNVNDAPVLDNPVDDQSYDEHFGIEYVNLTGVFSDPDGDVVTLSASSSNESVVTVQISGSNLVITEVGVGTASVTIEGSDGTLEEEDVISVEVVNVNDAPEIVSPLPGVSYNEGFGSETINLGPVFNDPDGDIISYSAISSNTGCATVSLSGAILTITEGALGSTTITVTASDGTLDTDDEFVVTVNNVNDRPEVITSIGDRDFAEGFGSQSINLSLFFSDPDGNPLSYSVSNTGSGVISTSVSGSILTILELGIGSSTVTVTASDGSLTVDESFEVNVNNVNDAPVVENPISAQSLNEYFGTEDIPLAGVFSDPDGDVLSYTAISSNNGAVSVTVFGSTLRLTEKGLGSSTIIVTAFDGEKTVTNQFTVFVNNVNDAPVVVNPLTNRVLSEGFTSTTFTLAPVFNDPDGNSLTLSAVSSDEGVVTVSVTGTILTVTEVGLGTATIIVTANDGELTVSDDFLITVSNVNDPPFVASPVPDQSLPEHFGVSTIDLDLVFGDPDGNVLTYTPASSDVNVVSVKVTGSILTITEEGKGSATVTVTASDAILTVSDAFKVTVYNVNDAPEVVSSLSDLVLNEHFTTEVIDLSGVFADPDGDMILLTASSADPTIAAVNISGTTLAITERGLGTTTITINASDGALSGDDQFQVTINNVNDAPVVEMPVADQDLLEHFNAIAIDISGVFSDPDGNPLIYSAESSNTGVVSVSVFGSTLTITEVGLGGSTISLSASDGVLSTSIEFDIDVANVNDAPVIVSGISDLVLDEHFASIILDMEEVFSDLDGDALTITAVSSSPSVVIAYVLETKLYISEAGLGSSTISITASDGTLSTTDEFDVTVNNVNDPPKVVAFIPDENRSEYFGSFTVDLSGVFIDPDGDEVQLSAVSSKPSVVTVSLTGETLLVSEVGLGSSIITITGTDGLLSTDNTFTVYVGNVNDQPQLVNPIADQSLQEHFIATNIDISSVFVDKDGDDLTIVAASSNENVVTVSVSGTTLVITEVGLGNSTITLTANDGMASASDQFALVVINVNDAPVVLNPLTDHSVGEQFGSMTIALAEVFEDPDGDPVSLSATSSNTGVATVSMSGTTLTITEVAKGSTTIIVTASDGTLESSDQFVLTIDDVNFAPTLVVAIDDMHLLEHFASDSIDLKPIFSDMDGDVLAFSGISSNTDVVTVEVVRDTLVIYEVGLGTATITVKADDGELYVEDQFDIEVSNVNDSPVINTPIEDQVLIQGFDSVYFDLNSVFIDPDDDPMTFSAMVDNSVIAEMSLEDGILIIKGIGVGDTEVWVSATDGVYSTTDTLIVTVLEEIPLIVYYEGQLMHDGDTVVRCNDAGEFYFQIRSGDGWDYYSEAGWMALDVENDTSLYIAYAENFSGVDRVSEFKIDDAQGHEMIFIIKQTVNCKPDAIFEAFSVDIKMYPNPVKDLLTIDVSEIIADRLSVELVDAMGRRMTIEQYDRGYSERIVLDMSGYKYGVYYVKVSDGERGYVEKVVR